MTQVRFFMYCEGVTQDSSLPNPKPLIQGPLTKLSPQYIPGAFTFSIVVGVENVEASGIHKLNLIFKDPDGNPLVPIGPIDIPSPAESNDDGTFDLMLNADLRNAVIERTGVYTTEVILNGVSLGDYQIKAVVGKKNG